MYDTLSRMRVRESKHASDNQDARTDELCKLNVALVARESRVNDSPAKNHFTMCEEMPS